jgi:magnesium transporter
MLDTYQTLILPDLRQMLSEGDALGLAEFCRVVHPVVMAQILEQLEEAEVWSVLDQADLDQRIEIFENISLRRQTELVVTLDSGRLSELLENMSSDDRVDLLTRMPSGRREVVLRMIAQAERNDIRRLLSYDEDSAGSLMTTEYASLPGNITVRDAIDRLREQAPNSETIYYVYILDEERRLEGLVSLRELILARPDAIVSDIMQRDMVRMQVTEPPETVAQELALYDLIAMPIVDADNRLVGIVTHDDAIDVVQEEATEDAYLQSAVQPLDDSYQDTPMLTILWKRGVWLLFLSFVALMTAKVLDHYRIATETGYLADKAPPDLTTLILLFLPLVMASGGNAGSQSATLFIRMLALSPTDSRNSPPAVSRRVKLREFAIAASLGSGLATFDFFVAWLILGKTSTEALTIAATVLSVVIFGTTAGTAFPLLFRRLGMDPALMSNPLIAALVDILGVVFFYEIAMLLL